MFNIGESVVCKIWMGVTGGLDHLLIQGTYYMSVKLWNYKPSLFLILKAST